MVSKQPRGYWSPMIKSFKGKVSLVLILAFSCFIALGMVTGLLGVAWPSIRGTFNLPLDALVALLVSSTLGFLLGSILAGQLMLRMGVATTLMMTNLIAAVGLIGYVLAPGWWVLVAFGLLTGWASGSIDTGLNIYMAANHGVAVMNWMHACFGIGAAIGPLVMTTILAAGLSWRVGYAIAAMVHLTLGLLFLVTRNRMAIKPVTAQPSSASAKPLKAPKPMETLKLPVVLLSILLFLLYTGVESSTGQWTFTLFTESRSVSPYLAGVMTSMFWAMLTLGRIVLGAAANRIGVERLLRLSMIGVFISAILFLFKNATVGFIAVSLMGFSLSAIFPTLTADTPHRVGIRHAPNTIGFQTGSASVGFAILPGIAGILAERIGLETLGPFLIISSLLMLVTNEIVVHVMKRNRRGEANVIPDIFGH